MRAGKNKTYVQQRTYIGDDDDDDETVSTMYREKRKVLMILVKYLS